MSAVRISATVADRAYRLSEGKIRFDSRLVGFVDARHFAEVPLTFGVLGRKQVASRRLRA